MRKLEKQKLEATIINQEALIERLRGRLCKGNHNWINIEDKVVYEKEVQVTQRKVCIDCELIQKVANI